MLDHLPVDPHGWTVLATGVFSNVAIDQSLPFVFQLKLNPAGHLEAIVRPNLCAISIIQRFGAFFLYRPSFSCKSGNLNAHHRFLGG